MDMSVILIYSVEFVIIPLGHSDSVDRTVSCSEELQGFSWCLLSLSKTEDQSGEYTHSPENPAPMMILWKFGCLSITKLRSGVSWENKEQKRNKNTLWCCVKRFHAHNWNWQDKNFVPLKSPKTAILLACLLEWSRASLQFLVILTHSLTHSLTHNTHTHALTFSLTFLLTYLLTHLLTHLLNNFLLTSLIN